jgi:hypothetical protein
VSITIDTDKRLGHGIIDDDRSRRPHAVAAVSGGDVQGPISGFASAGLVEVLLPSGYRVRGVLPGFAELARRGLLDRRVVAAAMRLADPSWLRAATEDEQETSLREVVDAKVAGFPLEAQDPGDETWKPVHLSIADLATMDQRDRERLEELVMRIHSAESITAAVERGDFGLREQASDLDSLAEFRDGPDGAADSGYREGVGHTPQPAPVGGG